MIPGSFLTHSKIGVRLRYDIDPDQELRIYPTIVSELRYCLPSSKIRKWFLIWIQQRYDIDPDQKLRVYDPDQKLRIYPTIVSELRYCLPRSKIRK